MNLLERGAKTAQLLEAAYPDAVCALLYEKDYELLFATRLSAQCTDARVNIVTKDLFQHFPSLKSFATAAPEEIEAIVRSCGLGPTKARDISAAAKMLLSEYGGKVPDNMTDLLKLPGVGRKTANLILGDIFHQPAIVVDTHCIRLSNRLGFVENTKDPVKIELALKKIISPSVQSDFCHRLVLHGREVCLARKPRCEHCCLGVLCPSYPAP